MASLILSVGCFSAPLLKASGAISLSIPPLVGESTTQGHQNEIDVLNFDFGISANFTSGSSGASVGKPSFSDLRIQKTLDRSSAKLTEAVAKGIPFGKATLTIQRTSIGTQGLDYYTIVLEDVYVTGVSMAGSNDGGVPTETVTLAFSKITWTYKYFGPDGKVKDTITTSAVRP